MKKNKKFGMIIIAVVMLHMVVPIANATYNDVNTTNNAITKSSNNQSNINSSSTNQTNTSPNNTNQNKEDKAPSASSKEDATSTEKQQKEEQEEEPKEVTSTNRKATDNAKNNNDNQDNGIMPLSTREAQTIANGTYTIKSVLNTNKVLDIAGASKNNGANVQIYKENTTNAQKFNVTYLGNGYYSIQSVHTKKVLDVAGAGKTNGTNVQQYDSNNSDAQKWVIKKTKSGYYSIVSKCNGLYLDVAGASAKDGTNIQMYKGNGTKSQLFVFEKTAEIKQTIKNGTYTIKSALNTSKVLDIAGASTSNGANVQIYKDNTTNAQKFNVTYLGDGYYSIQSVYTKKVLDVAGAGTVNGTNVQQYTGNNTTAQKWIIKQVKSGYYSIISKCNGLYLDVAGGKATDGQNIQMYKGNGTNSQLFVFEQTQELKQTIKDGMYKIKSAKDRKKVLDISGSSTKNSANVLLWSDSNKNNQKFHVTYLGNGYYSIKAVHSKLSLDVAGAGTTNGTNVQQYTYNGSNAQKWAIKDWGNGKYSIMSKCNGLYLDINGGATTDGTNVQMYKGNGSEAQKFIFEATSAQAIENGMYEIQTALSSNKVLDVSGGSTANSANIQIWGKSDVNQQKFNVTHIGNNYYTIQAVHSKKSLDVAGAGKINGTNVQQYASNTSDAQKWLIKDLGDGYYSIISKCNGLYLDVAGASKKDGTNVQMHKGNNTASQKFRFVKTTAVGTSNFSTLNESKYPSYKALLQKVQNQHPNWIITVKYTGLDWNTAVNNEDQLVGASPKSLTQYGNQWKNGNTQYGTGWYRASKSAIAYMMDPRNSLTEDYIFQFQDLTSTVGTSSDISKMIAGTFLTKYTTSSTQSIINTILSCSKTYGVSPYHIVSRMIQEQGKNGSTLNGYTYNGRKVYNLFNIGASGNSDAEIIKNGAARAYNEKWFSPELCINGSVKFLNNEYFKKGQTTLYFQKYNVVDKNNLYNHQYMQNIRAANDEGKRIYEDYKKNGLLNLRFEFVIPVYENMPSTACPRPAR